MNDLKYIITSVYLYDNQLNFDYLFLHDNNDLPYRLREKLQGIYHDPEWKLKGLREEKIKELLNIHDVFPIKANDYIELVKVADVAHNDRYKAYDIYWNETKSGINLFEWKRAEVWNYAHPSQVWTMRIDEYKENRIKEIRNNLIETIL